TTGEPHDAATSGEGRLDVSKHARHQRVRWGRGLRHLLWDPKEFGLRNYRRPLDELDSTESGEGCLQRTVAHQDRRILRQGSGRWRLHPLGLRSTAWPRFAVQCSVPVVTTVASAILGTKF